MKLRRLPPRRKDHHRRRKVPRLKPSGAWPARVFRILPDPARPYFHVEVRVHRTPGLMHREARRLDGGDADGDWAGLCRTWHSRRLRQSGVTRPRGLVARIYLNVRELQRRPSEIVSHECAHAAMGWARIRRANLRVMPGEEVMCYALGKLVAQANHNLYAMNAFH